MKRERAIAAGGPLLNGDGGESSAIMNMARITSIARTKMTVMIMMMMMMGTARSRTREVGHGQSESTGRTHTSGCQTMALKKTPEEGRMVYRDDCG